MKPNLLFSPGHPDPIFGGTHTHAVPTIILSVGVGIGSYLVYRMYLGRHGTVNRRRISSIFFAIALVLVSCFCFVFGVVYISEVWLSDVEVVTDDDSYGVVYANEAAVASAIILWPIFTSCYHVVYFCYSRRMFSKDVSTRFTSQVFRQNPTPKVAMSLLPSFEASATKTQETSDNTGNGTTALSLSERIEARSDEQEGGVVDHDAGVGQGEAEASASGVDQGDAAAAATGVDQGEAEGAATGVGRGEATASTDPPPHESVAPADTVSTRLSVIPPPVEAPANDDALKELQEVIFEGEGEDTEDDVGDYMFHEPQDPPTYSLLFRAKLYETFPYLCCCFKNAHGRSNVPEPRPSYIAPQEKSFWRDVGSALLRLGWYAASGFFLYLTIVRGPRFDLCSVVPPGLQQRNHVRLERGFPQWNHPDL
jgi:hypothetical protein